MPSATERVHEELDAHGPLPRNELHRRFDDLSEQEVDTALEHLHTTGKLTFGDEGYDVTEAEHS